MRAYFSVALERFPDLHFSALCSFARTDSIVFRYRSVGDLDGAETMVFNDSGRVNRTWAHHNPAPTEPPIG